jgi:hypothetical protein
MQKSFVARTVCALAVVTIAGAGASAAPITFIHTAVDGSGSIGDIEFVRKDITITATGDTAARVDLGNGFAIEHISASIEIQDVGTFDFQVPTRTYVNNEFATAGFSRSTDGGEFGTDLVDSGEDPSLAAWDMLSSFGPVPGDGGFLQWSFEDVLTSGGVLFFNDNPGLGGTFEAIVIPAPASIAAFASVGLLAGRRRR